MMTQEDLLTNVSTYARELKSEISYALSDRDNSFAARLTRAVQTGIENAGHTIARAVTAEMRRQHEERQRDDG